jgi:hypothetical protein
MRIILFHNILDVLFRYVWLETIHDRDIFLLLTNAINGFIESPVVIHPYGANIYHFSIFQFFETHPIQAVLGQPLC